MKHALFLHAKALTRFRYNSIRNTGRRRHGEVDRFAIKRHDRGETTMGPAMLSQVLRTVRRTRQPDLG